MNFRETVETYVKTEQMLNEMKPETRRKLAGILAGASIGASAHAGGIGGVPLSQDPNPLINIEKIESTKENTPYKSKMDACMKQADALLKDNTYVQKFYKNKFSGKAERIRNRIFSPQVASNVLEDIENYYNDIKRKDFSSEEEFEVTKKFVGCYKEYLAAKFWVLNQYVQDAKSKTTSDYK